MLSLIFIVASTNQFFNTEKTVSRIENASMGFIGNILGTPETAVILSGIVMLIAGISLLMGFKSRIVAIVLIAVLIPITLTIQVGQISTLGPLFKNIAILGGLLFFTLNDTNNLLK
ncbi:DoxX family protein [Flavobacterium sp. CS20]|uniref:DoxX family protein n=1 Tax=Flavobacterium sp. CS20 TaxID=2775246 RepID=UPI001B3A3C28|nr:DoxX family protein [Flavobacterium sp. CS20]QTY27672.1 DoxX family protein [Flavobacterium sp. CS20]